MTLRLNGATSGFTEIDAPAVAGNNNLKLPTGNGSDGNILGTDGAGNLSWVNGRMVLGTSQASTSGTSIDFTGIPSWVKRVTVMFDGVSTNGTSSIQLQIGDSGGIETTGYNSSCSIQTGATVPDFSAGFGVAVGVSASATYSGKYVIDLLSGNTWAGMGIVAQSGGGVRFGAGSKTLSATLDRVRITTVNGTDTFDAGSINLLLEG